MVSCGGSEGQVHGLEVKVKDDERLCFNASSIVCIFKCPSLLCTHHLEREPWGGGRTYDPGPRVRERFNGWW